MSVANDAELEALAARLDAADIDGLWITFHDYAARACAKWIPKASIPSALRSGGVFCRANLNFSIDDHQSDAPHFGADAGDFFAVPDPATFAPVPYRPGIGRVLSWLCDEAGELWEGCPRGRLARVLEQLAARGLTARAGLRAGVRALSARLRRQLRAGRLVHDVFSRPHRRELRAA